MDLLLPYLLGDISHKVFSKTVVCLWIAVRAVALDDDADAASMMWAAAGTSSSTTIMPLVPHFYTEMNIFNKIQTYYVGFPR